MAKPAMPPLRLKWAEVMQGPRCAVQNRPHQGVICRPVWAARLTGFRLPHSAAGCRRAARPLHSKQITLRCGLVLGSTRCSGGLTGFEMATHLLNHHRVRAVIVRLTWRWLFTQPGELRSPVGNRQRWCGCSLHLRTGLHAPGSLRCSRSWRRGFRAGILLLRASWVITCRLSS